MKRPAILVVAHRREVDSVLGPHWVSLVAEAYLERIHRAGGTPLLAWPGSDDLEQVAPARGVLLIGGGDVAPRRSGSGEPGDAVDAARDALEIGLVERCRAGAIPLLGVCRGAQVLNVALGGTLRTVDGHRQDEPLARASHAVDLERGSRLAALTGVEELKVNSFHRWAVDRPGTGLAVTARSADGVVEGVEWDGPWWCVGAQWHAEMLEPRRVPRHARSLEADDSQALFNGLVGAAR